MVVKNYAKSDIRVICSCAIFLFCFKTLSVIVGISKKAVYANDLLSKGGDFDQEINLWFRCWSSEQKEDVVFFSMWVCFHEHLRYTGLLEKWEGISLTTHYHFYPLGNYCRELTSAHSQQQDSNQKPLVSERKSLTILQLIFQIKGIISILLATSVSNQSVEITANSAL